MLIVIQVPWEKVKDRDERFGVETSRKKEARKGIKRDDSSRCRWVLEGK
jgi:hypothetical protein